MLAGRFRMTEGLLDTNLFIHAYTSDQHSLECQKFLAAISRGEVQGWLDMLVVHEITYSLPRYVKEFTRESLADYLIDITDWPGVLCDRDVLVDALTRWKVTPGLSFVDAYLAAVAITQGVAVFTKNVRELTAQGAEVPVPLPN